ncbi:MAG: error-prone DNA polymerase [Phycisphaeraceae bacterium]|nr:error-prone DNA polymerase [Phycisphaerales bacterium]MCB9843540.1 error-prone DNA polymerase [Phycisphaeraceae bacterium]
MPELPDPKAHPHPYRDPSRRPLSRRTEPGARYAELAVTTNFSFLRGASHPEEFVERATALGHAAACIADRNSLAGIVRAHVTAKQLAIPLAIGCRLVFTDPHGLSVLVYPTGRAAYARLCTLLTLGKRRAPKGECHLTLHDLIAHEAGLLAVVIPTDALDERLIQTVKGLADVFDDDRLSIATYADYAPDDTIRMEQIGALSEMTGVPVVAINDCHYHDPARRALQDVVTCIRHGCTLDEAGYRLSPNAERHLKPPEEMERLFASLPGAIERSADIALRASAFSLDELRYEYPDEIVPTHTTMMHHLRDLTERGATERYPEGVPEKIRTLIGHELALIDELDYAPYFLTVHDIVVFARSRGILCQGRGAAANSAVCFCLGVTSVDPDRVTLLFERFISKERNEPPDIDIDFEHERREEVIQYLYSKYGRDRAALTAEVITYRGRSAIREVGKALGLSLDCVDRLAKSLDWWDKGVIAYERLRELGLNDRDRTLRLALELAGELIGFPRHLSQHVGGFVITRTALSELVPIENASMPDRTVIEWDKDDIDAMGMLKVDCLGLGMMTAIRKSLELIGAHEGERYDLATIPAEDPKVYDMICEADTVGVFQIESRAQMAMSPRLRPRCYYDLVIEVAIVRPGPIQGKMVHPYLRRRAGLESAEYPDDRVRAVLGRTLGVPLFQEQAMAMAVVAAGFTPGEADQLRRSMAAWKRSGNAILRFEQKLIEGMTSRGYTREFALGVFEQIKGFSGYGFPESHAASFAHLVYASAWIKRHHPAAFACALINSQPMGFYAPAQIVNDARKHGVEVRPIDANASDWDCTLEPRVAADHDAPTDDPATWGRGGPVLRLGMRLVKGLIRDDADAIHRAVASHRPASSIEQLRRWSGVRIASVRALARADAFASMGLDRQRALWQVRALRDEPLPLFDEIDNKRDTALPVRLPPIAPLSRTIHDYATTGLSLKPHPLAYLRSHLDALGVATSRELADEDRSPHGRRVRVAGIVLVRQRPGTASGIVFITMEDETGIANLILRPKVYKRFRSAARHAVVILAHGTVERQGSVVHVMTRRVESIDDLVTGIATRTRNFH